MSIVRNILFLNLVLFISTSFVCSFPSSEGKTDKPKEDVPDSEEGKSEKKLETESTEETDKSKEENQEENALTSSPEENEPLEEKEKNEDQKELPEKNEEELDVDTDDDDDEDFKNFRGLLDKAASESSDEKEIEKSPDEMKELKEEAFKITNKLNEKEGISEVSQEKFNKVWDKKKNEYGEKFPLIIEKVIHSFKTTEENKESVKEEEKSSETPSEVSTEVSETAKEIPKDTYVVRNAKGKICILAKFHYTISAFYPVEQGHQELMGADQTFYVNTNRPGNVSGNCGGPNEAPSLRRSIDDFTFILMFDKISDSMWGVTSVQLSYQTSDLLYIDPLYPEKVIAKSKNGKWFETPFKRSHYCPAQEVFHLFSENQEVATVEMKDVHLQAYDVEDGKFSTSYRCDKVVLDGLEDEPFVRDETVPLAVGCTLALITLLILIGFSVHRAYYAAKVDYNTVE